MQLFVLIIFLTVLFCCFVLRINSLLTIDDIGDDCSRNKNCFFCTENLFYAHFIKKYFSDIIKK